MSPRNLQLSVVVAIALCNPSPAWSGDDSVRLEAGPQPPNIASMEYSAALGQLAAHGWKGPTVISNSGHMSDDVKCWDDGKNCLQAFFAPVGNNMLQIVKTLHSDVPYVEKFRLIPSQCACEDINDDEGFPWTGALRWDRVNADTYINKASVQVSAANTVSVDVMNDYKEISSAQMFGLSDVEHVMFFCLQSRFVSKSDRWYSDRMGRGRLVKTFNTPSVRPSPVPISYLKVFADVCSP